MLLTCVVFAGPAFAIWSFLNTVAIFYGSTAAFPFGYILLLFAAWLLVTVPLTLVGATVGRQIALRTLRNSETKSYFPCRINKLERRIPPENCSGSMCGIGTCLRSKYFQYAICGILPFCSIYVEIHYIFDSVWGMARYYDVMFESKTKLCWMSMCWGYSLIT